MILAVISTYYNYFYIWTSEVFNYIFANLITLIKTTRDNYNVVALYEKGKNKIKNREVELKSKYGLTMKYELPNSAKGGVGLIYDSKLNLLNKEDLKIKPKAFGEYKSEIENIWYETDVPIKQDKYEIKDIYWHPGGTNECLNYFTQQLENIMIKVNSENKKCW